MIVTVTQVTSSGHSLPGHPESPNRFQFLNLLGDEELASQLRILDPRPIAQNLLTQVHRKNYLALLESSCRRGGFLDYGDTYVTAQSMESALLAAGGTVAVLDEILDGHAECGFAIIRPPGHHASQDAAMGFCLLNNIAIAAHHAKARGIRRIMVVDFDVHHGNGTQAIFDHDPEVLYLSTHQFGIFPGTGLATDIGVGPGKGSSVNIPLPPHAGDKAFKTITQAIINPIADRFMPEMLLISAGFDAHWQDPLASLSFSTAGYFDVAQSMLALAERHTRGRLLYVLEGGYHPQALAESIQASLYGLSDSTPPTDFPRAPEHEEPELTALLDRLRKIHELRD